MAIISGTSALGLGKTRAGSPGTCGDHAPRRSARSPSLQLQDSREWDLVLTCYSAVPQLPGLALGRGLSSTKQNLRSGRSPKAFTVRAVAESALALSVELPVSRECRLLYEGSSPQDELERLIARDQKAEYPPAILWEADMNDFYLRKLLNCFKNCRSKKMMYNPSRSWR